MNLGNKCHHTLHVTPSLNCPLLFLHAEYQEHPSSDGPPTKEWVLTDVAVSSQLGTEQRVRAKEEIISAGIQPVEGFTLCSSMLAVAAHEVCTSLLFAHQS